MRLADRLGALLLLAFAVGFSANALQFTYWGENGPGSGFLPFWLGLVMAVLAILLVVSSRGGHDAPWLPSGRGRTRLVVVVLASALFVAALPITGMVLGMALFLAALLRFLERYSWRTALGVAAGMAVANHLVFTRWLSVPFPTGVLGL